MKPKYLRVQVLTVIGSFLREISLLLEPGPSLHLQECVLFVFTLQLPKEKRIQSAVISSRPLFALHRNDW